MLFVSKTSYLKSGISPVRLVSIYTPWFWNLILHFSKEKIFEFKRDEEQEENKEKKRNNKRFGTDYKIDKNYNYPKIDYFPNLI